MNDKRFERVYGDIEVVCIDHQKNGEDKFIDYADYDKFVELLNELHEENQELRMYLGWQDMELEEMRDLE